MRQTARLRNAERVLQALSDEQREVVFLQVRRHDLAMSDEEVLSDAARALLTLLYDRAERYDPELLPRVRALAEALRPLLSNP